MGILSLVGTGAKLAKAAKVASDVGQVAGAVGQVASTVNEVKSTMEPQQPVQQQQQVQQQVQPNTVSQYPGATIMTPNQKTIMRKDGGDGVIANMSDGQKSDVAGAAITTGLSFVPGVGTALSAAISGADMLTDAIQKRQLAKKAKKEEYGIVPAHKTGFFNLFGYGEDKKRYADEFAEKDTNAHKGYDSQVANAYLSNKKGGLLLIKK